MSISDVKPLYDLAADVLLAILDNQEFTQTAERRKRAALDQISDATHSLYAACVNLDLISDQDD